MAPSEGYCVLHSRKGFGLYECGVVLEDRGPLRRRARRKNDVHAQVVEAERPMAKSKKRAEVVFLVCEESGDLNYTLKRKPGGEKLKLKKYCPRLRKHTWHVEKKK
jgi:large subunit ribosomal protein L33